MKQQRPHFPNITSRMPFMPSLSLRRAGWLALLAGTLALAACNQPDKPQEEANAARPAKAEEASAEGAKEKETGEKEAKEAGEAGHLKLSAEEIATAGIRVEALEEKPVAVFF